MFPWKFFRWHRQGPLTWNGLNENKTKNYLQAKELLYMDSCCFYLLHLAQDYTEIFMLKYFSVEHGVTVVTRTKPATVLWEITSLEPLVHYQVVAKYVSNCIKFLFKGVSFEDVHLNWLNLFLLILTHGRSILYTNKLHDFSVTIIGRSDDDVYPVGIYLLKVNNRNSRTRCEVCSKLTMFIANFEHISHLVLVFPLLTISM